MNIALGAGYEKYYRHTNLDNAIIQYFNNIIWCMKNDMLDGVLLLLNNIPPNIIPFVYYDTRTCRLIISAYVYGCSYIIPEILNKLIYRCFITKKKPNFV
jgi:hypothetical protein